MLLTALVLAGSVSAGYWQLDRARQKQSLIDAFNRGGGTTVALDEQPLSALARYQHVSAKGSYDAAHQVLLDNMPSSTGRPGYRVLTPFVRASGGDVLLVDRGWVPLGPTREQLPDVAVGGEAREIGGTLDQLPVPGVKLGPANEPGVESWPRVLNFPTQQEVEAVLGRKVGGRILLLDPNVADGYERKWKPSLDFGPERHLGYAFQWFAFGLATVVIFFALSLRTTGAGRETS
jgi:surfeit locus 1 family protein